MEIEDKLKDAANWQPGSEMPLGLERRALEAHVRPPLRPIGLTRPRNVLLATAFAGVVCSFFVLRVEQEPLPSPQPLPANTPIPQVAIRTEKTSEHLEEMPKQMQHFPKRLQELPKQIQQSSKRLQKIDRPRRKESPLTRRFPVAVDTQSDSVKAGSRVAVEAPLYTPAYYAEPSADGQSVSYTPVSVALDDPDVIYSETTQEN